MIELTVNGEKRSLDVDPDTPLLWVLRDTLRLTGTKFGCGEGACGACTVIAGESAIRSCVTPVSSVAGATVTTIEGVPDGHPLKKAWLDEEVSQCGYCQPGQIMSALDLLSKKPAAGEDDIDRSLSGNLCRCGTYNRIRKAVLSVAEKTGGKTP